METLIQTLVAECKALWLLTLAQFSLVFPYWLVGLLAGSVVSVFASDKIRISASRLGAMPRLEAKWRLALDLVVASVLGAASPVCMYGTVPIIASLGKKGVGQHALAAFMVSSIMINPNLFVFSLVLGLPVALARLVSCLLAGVVAGALVRVFFRDRPLFDFAGFGERSRCASPSPSARAFLSDAHRAVVKTAPYLFAGIVLTALFSRYVPSGAMASALGGNRRFGVFLSASLGIPVYVCGGGTIPLLREWLAQGMSVGAAIAFMLSGAATKLTNLSAVKTILGLRNFALYAAYCVLFAIAAGLATNAIWGCFP